VIYDIQASGLHVLEERAMMGVWFVIGEQKRMDYDLNSGDYNASGCKRYLVVNLDIIF